ncbi:hypothetical protein [Mycobacterium paraseoulense]|uniref:Transmembrane protein n=1 Tax=Mycobacterium paraseoulense TaxID=590652 RepID=A0A1X0ICY6_9MYCO|nr:hypothetical protein [Mycobacterium paraseoulense]MCV7396756.1 hypothetical protein [Mycobacterium paraseoulense]ORB43269.1 hypothetical protein BST39_08505 [Mycobacterium paraseoulense]BBZ72658.1 hypothetical protein MPRS_37510 [Mycobacterium paraseoulense]
MSRRGPAIFSVATVALVIGLCALRFPVFIDAYDQFGWQVKCGSGFTTDLTQASVADGNKNDHGGPIQPAPPRTNYVDQCDNALFIRRAWAIPAATVGGLTLVGLAAAALAHDRRHARS